VNGPKQVFVSIAIGPDIDRMGMAGVGEAEADRIVETRFASFESVPRQAVRKKGKRKMGNRSKFRMRGILYYK
jgi:hypothetical protein